MQTLAVRILESADRLETGSRQFCSWAEVARAGRDIYITRENISCPLARYNLGYKDYSTQLASTLVSWGDADDETAAEKYLKSAHRLQGPRVIYLSRNTEKADVVVCFGTPDEMMINVKVTLLLRRYLSIIDGLFCIFI